MQARAESASAELDRLVTEESAVRRRLNARARAMYQADGTSLLDVIFGAATFEQFATGWDLLTRIGRSDAADLVALTAAQERVRQRAEGLLALQVEQAEAVDAVARELARARRDLAASKAALAAFEARASSGHPAAPRRRDSTQRLRGSGEWRTAKASHYGRNFSGRGASGERIGPYSMIVAHKTLRFGTLIEFEYNGKRAVARVVDRGPYVAGRTFDLGPGVVRVLGFNGVHMVRYRIIKR
jgi:rare lipoprotein A